MRRSAAHAVSKLGPAAATDAVLGGLEKLLTNEFSTALSESAIRVMDRLSPVEGGRIAKWLINLWAEATESAEAVLQVLEGLFWDEDSALREVAALAIGKLGAVSTALILHELAELLRDEDDKVRQLAALALGHIGPSVVTDEILHGLEKLFRDEDRGVRHSAALTAGRLGSVAATKAILGGLAGLLLDDDSVVRHSAANAVNRLGRANLRIFQKKGRWIAKAVSELATL